MGLIERGILGGQRDGAAGEPGSQGLREEVALPDSEVGPLDKAPLMRLAATWAAEAMGVSLKKEVAQGG